MTAPLDTSVFWLPYRYEHDGRTVASSGHLDLAAFEAAAAEWLAEYTGHPCTARAGSARHHWWALRRECWWLLDPCEQHPHCDCALLWDVESKHSRYSERFTAAIVDVEGE